MLYKQNSSRKGCSEFQHLSKLPEILQDDVTHFEALREDFTRRFEDLLNFRSLLLIINLYIIRVMEEANLIS